MFSVCFALFPWHWGKDKHRKNRKHRKHRKHGVAHIQMDGSNKYYSSIKWVFCILNVDVVALKSKFAENGKDILFK